MAFTVTLIDDEPHFKSWDIIADSDADTITQFAHGFVDGQGNPVRPRIVWTNKLLNLISVWGATANLINIDAFKAPEATSGNAGAQVRVYAQLPHSLML